MSSRQAKNEDCRNANCRNEQRRPLSFIALLSILLIVPALSPPSIRAQDPTCATAETLTPDSILRRQYDTPPTDPDLVRIPISEPGVLELYISGGTQAAAPRISFQGMDCSTASGEDHTWVRIRETPRELHLLIRQRGDFFATISSQDPSVPISSYSLHATFAAEISAPDELITLAENPPADCRAADLPSFAPEPFAESRFVVLRRNSSDKDVDPWDDDGTTGGVAAPGVLIIEGPEAELEASLHDAPDCLLEHRVAEGLLDRAGAFLAAPVHAGMKRILIEPRSIFDQQYEVHIRHFALCTDATAEQVAEDHPDRPLCAATLPWEEPILGSIASGGDEDHFMFTLDGQETVAIDLSGWDGVRSLLYDEDGQLLEIWGYGQLVRTLGPGRFFILVAGADGWVGEYSLRLQATP